MRLKKASNLKLAQIEWLWKGRLPFGAVSIIEGDPGTSKSTLVATIAAHVSRGESWPDGESCPQGTAIICNAEDPEEEVILPRLLAAQANLEKVQIIVPSSKDDVETFTIPDHVGALKKAIEEENIKMISFDPLEAFLSIKVNNISNHHIRHALRSLEQLAKQTCCAILVVRHLNKDSNKAAIYRGGGSIGIVGAARSAILVAKDPSNDQRCFMLPHKANWSSLRPAISYSTEDVEVTDGRLKVQTSQIKWGGEVGITAEDLLAQITEVSDESGLKEAGLFLRQQLADGPKDSSELFELAEQVGVGRAKLFQGAKISGIIKRPENGKWIWALPANFEGGIFI